MATKKRPSASAPAHLRRMYLDCRYGQLHLATAYPASGGFDEASPIVFLHAEDGTGADFNRCAALLGTDRSIYAPDLPGSGGSDAPKGRMAIAGLALAVVDLIDQLRIRRVDLVGAGRGALVAYELAATRPQAVRRLVVAGNQEPAIQLPQPMLQVSNDAARILEEPAEALAGEIRAFLDRV
jgi:pimeloyl-ACP methyl ester carboxylesterase